MPSRPIVLAAILLVPLAASTAQPNHPLNPLTGDEYRAVVSLLAAAGHTGSESRFPLISLEPPPKAALTAWQTSRTAPPRVATAVVRHGGRVFEARIDLTAGRVADWRPMADVETSILLEEFGAAQQAAITNPEMVAALAKRGITDLGKVFCAPFTMGYFNLPSDRGMRLLKVGCFDLRRATNNVFGWPIEGLYAIVDLRQGKTVRVYDSGVVPIFPGNANFTEAAAGENGTPLRAPVAPVSLAIPRGSNAVLDGNTVRWQNWSFHYRVDRRQGPIVSLVSYRDRERDRSILHEGAMAEMFVPYMDPDFGWYSRSYFDMGEYGIGLMLTTLRREIDCPASAWFLNVVIHDDLGQPLEIPEAACLFERTTGGPAWRHAEAINQTYEGRPAIELVFRTAAAIGNYDYFMDWVFNQSGEIDVLIGATGITALKGVRATHMTSPTAAADTRYGTLVAPNLVAINHDHFFNFRLDFAVDGEANRFQRDVYSQTILPSASPRRSIYQVRPVSPSTETTARFNGGPMPSKWRVLSATATNAVGNPTSYEIMSMGDSHQMLSDDDYPLRRAGFTKYAFWVTPYAPRERYAAGDYPFQSRGGDGLPKWASAGRSVKNTDIVVWHTIGMHHLPRAEEAPVMPILWTGFKLRPFNFFDRNPALDLRAEFLP